MLEGCEKLRISEFEGILSDLPFVDREQLSIDKIIFICITFISLCEKAIAQQI